MDLPTPARRVAALARRSPARCGPVRVVCIDGPAGSGKTTLAAAVAKELDGAPVVHMDDLYLGWAQDIGTPLAARVGAWLLDAWQSGLHGRHLRYDWLEERYDEWVDVPAAPAVVLEGCGSAGRGIRERAALVVWVEAPPDLRLARGVARDGEALAPDWLAWQQREAAHFDADGTRAAAHVLVDGVTGALEAL